MKKTLAVIVTVGLMGTMGISTAWAGRISERQGNQERRIFQGLRSGALTWGEIGVLAETQRRIERTRMRAWADGRLTREERLRIERRQDKASWQIYRLKHNARVRY